MVSGTSTSPKTFRQAIVVLGVIEIQNPNLVKPKTVKARDFYIGKTGELSRRESVEIEKQRAHECYLKLQEQGKAEQSKKYSDCLALIAQERAEAAKKQEKETVACGVPKARIGGKSIKKLHRKNRSIWSLPCWKPFLMALRNRKKQRRVKGGTAACVKKAAKICHSSKSEESEEHSIFVVSEESEGGTAGCVKEAAKISDNSKSEDDLALTRFMEMRKACKLATKKNYYNRTPTFIGYSDSYKRRVGPYY